MSKIIGCLAALAVALGIATHSANAADERDPHFSVQGLLEECKQAEVSNSLEAADCIGYISGVEDVLVAAGKSQEFWKMGACGSFTYGAAKQAFLNWAAVHPEKWNNSRLVGVANALGETWPCKKAN